MGVSHYRFSIAWTRILPNGTSAYVNYKGVSYYSDIIDALISANITPVITLYHWDLPQTLQELGGWLNPDTAEYFAEYSRICFRYFGDRVKFWITINEPWVVAILGHETGEHAPGLNDLDGLYSYQVGHNLLKAHAKAYKIYQDHFKEQKGQVGISLNINWYEPLDFTNKGHLEATETKRQFAGGWFLQPLLINGDYPAFMRKRIGDRLPKFTPEEKGQILGSLDFLGINHYTSSFVFTALEKATNKAGWFVDSGAEEWQDPRWFSAASSWLKVAPFGLRRLLNWLKLNFDPEGQVPIYITENGFSDSLGNLDDLHRIYYLKHYINQLLKGLKCYPNGICFS